MTIPHLGEEYRCTSCEKNFQLLEINKDWKCPICREPISIKVEIDGYFHSCHRLNPSELEEGYSITFDRLNTHEILKVTPNDRNSFRVALGQYGVKNYPKDYVFLVIDGSWS